MKRNEVCCDNPRLLFNRGRIHDIKERGYYIKDVHYMLDYDIRDDGDISTFFSPFKRGLTHYLDQCRKSKGFFIDWNRIDDYYTYDAVGCKQPLFFIAECGKCKYCQQKKVMLKASRLNLESLRYDKLPLFVTLTYNRQHLPELGVDKRHVQLFLKRLRHKLGSFRYLCCSEYGKKRNRPHYHILLFGVDYNINIPASMNVVHDKISSAWSDDGRSSKGSVYGFVDVRPIRDFNGFIYVSKYISKKNVVPFGKNSNFVLQSNRTALGSNIIDKQFVKHFLTHPDKKYVIFNHHTGCCFDFTPQRYFIRKVLPSFSDYFSVNFRRVVDNIHTRISYLLRCNINVAPYIKRLNVYSDWFNFPCVEKDMFNMLPLDERNELEQLTCEVERYLSERDYKTMKKYLTSRNVLLSQFASVDSSQKRTKLSKQAAILEDKILL